MQSGRPLSHVRRPFNRLHVDWIAFFIEPISQRNLITGRLSKSQWTRQAFRFVDVGGTKWRYNLHFVFVV